MKRSISVLAVPALFAAAVAAHAQGPTTNCIELRNDVQMEQEVTDASGQKSVKLVPPAKVVPGNHVIYTITAHNQCSKPVDEVVVNNPVPEHLSYVADSATGPGTELRRPLGITIIGGLFVSQILTLYTTPVIYLLIDRLRRRREPAAVAAPAE